MTEFLYKLFTGGRDLTKADARQKIGTGASIVGIIANVLLFAGKFLMGTLKEVFYTNLVTKVSALTLKEKIKDIKQRFDAAEHGGAPILGITKPVIKAHGSSDSRAIKNAVRQAIHFVETGINDDIAIFAGDYDEKKLLADAEKMYAQI